MRGTFVRGAFAGTARSMLRVECLEFLKGDLAIGIGVHFLEGFLGLGRILLEHRAGFEFVDAQGAVTIGVEFLEPFLGTHLRVFAGTAGALMWGGRFVLGE